MADVVQIDLDSEEVREVLSMMIFSTGPIAHAFRANGHEIERRAEAEQVFVFRWLLKLIAQHGANWKRHAGEELERLTPPSVGD